MRKYWYLPLLIAICLFWACDKIDQPLKVQPASCGDCEVTANDELATQRNVLIEEFTGHTCNNCPLAANEIKRLQKEYGKDRIHAIAIHASNFAVPDPGKGYPNDYRTEEGSEIYSAANPFGVPSGLLSRLDYGTQSFVKLFGAWESKATPLLDQPAEIALGAEVFYNDTLREACINAKFRAEADLSERPLHWCAFLVEDGIVAPQTMPDYSTKEDYVHNFMLRGAFQDAVGTPIEGFDGTAGSTACTSRLITLDEEWNPASCSIVFYVYERTSDSWEVLQVITKKLQ